MGTVAATPTEMARGAGRGAAGERGLGRGAESAGGAYPSERRDEPPPMRSVLPCDPPSVPDLRRTKLEVTTVPRGPCSATLARSEGREPLGHKGTGACLGTVAATPTEMARGAGRGGRARVGAGRGIGGRGACPSERRDEPPPTRSVLPCDPPLGPRPAENEARGHHRAEGAMLGDVGEIGGERAPRTQRYRGRVWGRRWGDPRGRSAGDPRNTKKASSLDQPA